MCTSARVYLSHIKVGAPRQEGFRFPGMKATGSVSCLMWVLIEPQSSKSTARAISPDPNFFLFINHFICLHFKCYAPFPEACFPTYKKSPYYIILSCVRNKQRVAPTFISLVEILGKYSQVEKKMKKKFTICKN